MSLVRRRNSLSVLLKISNIRFCNNRTAIPFSVCEWARCRYRINRACTRLPGGLLRGPIRIVAIVVALVFCLLNDPPLYAASDEIMMIHNFNRDDRNNDNEVKKHKHYDGTASLNSTNFGIGQEFTTGPHSSGYLLTYLALHTDSFSNNVLGIVYRASIYTADDNGRSRLVGYMSFLTDTIRKDKSLRFVPRNGTGILLQPDTRYMFTLECVSGCDDGENRWVKFDTAEHDHDNDHTGSTQWQWGGCELEGSVHLIKCKMWPLDNWNGWSIENHHVTESDGWVHDGAQDQSLVIAGKAKFLFPPPPPQTSPRSRSPGNRAKSFLPGIRRSIRNSSGQSP